MSQERQKLLERIDAFCQRNDVAETRFGRDAVGDPNLIARLRAGRPVLDTTVRKIEDHMRTYKRGKPRNSLEAVA
jgi:hypothetical protein